MNVSDGITSKKGGQVTYSVVCCNGTWEICGGSIRQRIVAAEEQQLAFPMKFLKDDGQEHGTWHYYKYLMQEASICCDNQKMDHNSWTLFRNLQL
jgi:hypothetical protein